jgi:succinyldiaminopimelate transaminase
VRAVADLHLLAAAASLHDALAQRGIDAGPDPVDLSLGTPVDPTPAVAREALAAASDAPGYPLVWGAPPLREAVTAWLARRGATDLDPAGVLPTIGSKEAIGWLPTLLGLGAGDVVAHPALAYPTYAAGAHLAGATPVATRDLTALEGVRLAWVNSPANPHGAVATVDELRAAVAWARASGTLLVSDECYLTLGWEAEPVSVLDPRVCDGDPTGLLVCYSLSKQSNLAGYRAGFLAGDPAVVRALVEVRKHAGMIVPRPVQAVMQAVLADDAHVAEQKERYRARRSVLRAAVEAAGLRVEQSVGGLYLWCTRDEADWDTVAALARVGVLAAPGSFYGEAGARHVRLALTATDERVATAAERLAGLAS